jgi:hypothetical protein
VPFHGFFSHGLSHDSQARSNLFMELVALDLTIGDELKLREKKHFSLNSKLHKCERLSELLLAENTKMHDVRETKIS